MSYQIGQYLKKLTERRDLDRREFIGVSAEGLGGIALLTSSLYQAFKPAEVFADSGSDASYINNLGIRLFRKGDYHGALEKFRKAIETDKGYADAYIMTGRTYNKIDKPEQAIVYSNKALELCETEKYKRAVYKDLANAYLAIGNKELASQYLSEYERITKKYGMMNHKIAKLIADFKNRL